VPSVARYRKEATGALDDAKLRTLEERLRELDERRAAILDSIGQQGKVDAALKHAIDVADSKARLEDLYLPYRAKRRTKAQIAREADLGRASREVPLPAACIAHWQGVGSDRCCSASAFMDNTCSSTTLR
jgi:transcriptional accessory protein Tex/SPT6